jgi:trehalose synthase
MLDLVDLGPRSLESYRGLAPDLLLDELRSTAKDLRGARVLHVNATPYGGGVSELLRSLVPLLADLGIRAQWRIISGDESFFAVTKRLHNGMQGAEAKLTDEDQASYLETTRCNAAALTEEYDFVFLHDPQPAGILSMLRKASARWIWRCHVDTSSPNGPIWDFLRPLLRPYDVGVFTMPEFVPPDFPFAHVEIIPPAIDPRSPKNMQLSPDTAHQVLEWIGIHLDRPLVTQVARFDRWKDPLGTVAAYRLARKEVPNLELALVGALAHDDPEGFSVYRQVRDETRGDRLIHVFTNLLGVGNIEVNAFQRLSNVVVQKSLREGFGLVVSEALWKGTPVVAAPAGGIRLQMADGTGGELVHNVEECAQALVSLLRDPDRAKRLGESGRRRVRDHFLLPRLLLNDLRLMRDLSASRPSPRPPDGLRRDPVCGMALAEREPDVSARHGGVTYAFCSDQCRKRFLEAPSRYVTTSPGDAAAPAAGVRRGEPARPLPGTRG